MKRHLCAMLAAALLLACVSRTLRAAEEGIGDWETLLNALEAGESHLLIAGRIEVKEPLLLYDVIVEGVAHDAALVVDSLYIANDVTISSLTIESTGAEYGGEALVNVENGSSLTMENVFIQADAATHGTHGLLVDAGGSADLARCDISGGEGGHAVYARGEVNAQDCSLWGGESGAEGGDPQMRGCGLFLEEGASADLLRCGVFGGEASPAVGLMGGVASLSRCEMTGTPVLALALSSSAELTACALYANNSPLWVESGARVRFFGEESKLSFPGGSALFSGSGEILGLALELTLPDELTLEVGGSVALATPYSPSDAAVAVISWETDDLAIAQIDPVENRIYGKGEGIAMITASLQGGLSHTIMVTVLPRPTFDLTPPAVKRPVPVVRPPAVVILTQEELSEETEEPEAARVFLAGTDTNLHASESANSDILVSCEPGALLPAVPSSEGWLCVRVQDLTGYVPIESVLERAWDGFAQGYCAVTTREVEAYLATPDGDVTLPEGETLRTLLTAEDTTAALHSSGTVYLPSDALRLVHLPPLLGTVRHDGWVNLYAQPDPAGEVLANLADGVRFEALEGVGGDEWVCVRIGRKVGYLQMAFLQMDEPEEDAEAPSSLP